MPILSIKAPHVADEGVLIAHRGPACVRLYPGAEVSDDLVGEFALGGHTEIVLGVGDRLQQEGLVELDFESDSSGRRWDERPEDLTEHIRLMYDLLVLAFQTDSTRIATFMLANAGSNRSYKMVGVNDGHHQLSHHGNDKEKTDKIQKIDQYLVEQFAYFLDKLKSVQEGEGTLLDNSLVLYGSGLGDGNRHSHHDLPVLLAGNSSGKIQRGRHIVYPDNTPMNNLFLSLLDHAGAKVDKIGDSAGRLTGLEG